MDIMLYIAMKKLEIETTITFEILDDYVISEYIFVLSLSINVFNLSINWNVGHVI